MIAPKSLIGPQQVQLRRAALAQDHMAPLCAFAERLRAITHSGVPDFDPLDGGINAQCLFLLEAPGSRAIGSGFISRDNPDETAKNFWCLNREAGLARERTVTWNAVPWYLGTDTRIRAPVRADHTAAEEHVRELLSLLPELRVVVLVGRAAQRCSAVVRNAAPNVAVLSCPHPSPLSLNGRPERRDQMLRCLSSVAEMLGHPA